MPRQDLDTVNSEFINTMIKAGAGAGKTYGLIHKIVDLVREFHKHNPETLPRFVVTTFTRKATQEVRERLLSKALELRREDPKFGEIFLKFLKSSGYLMVSTIHGVLNQFLRQHGNIVGLDPDFRLISDREPLLTTLLHEILTSEPKMLEMVKKFGWRRLKLFLLEHHRSSILNPQISPIPGTLFIEHWKCELDQLQGAIFELKPYIEKLLIKSKSEALRKYDFSLGELQKALKAPADDLWQTLQVVTTIYQTMPKSLGAMTNWDDSAKELRKQITDILKEISDDPWTEKSRFETYLEDQETLSEIGHQFSQLWLKRKITLAELELEDLELLSLYILRTFPEQTKSFSESWNYWFIDEYQDTSPIQVEILNHLIGQCPHYVVGDPQQSIYFFRGARSKVFHEKLKVFAEGGAKIEVKKINRRSLTPTLCLINDLMDLVNKHQFTAMESLDEKKAADLLVGHFYFVPEDEKIHLQGVVKVVQNLLCNGVQPNAIALLCRENAELRDLFFELQAAGLPVQISSQGRFLEDRQVRDALVIWHFLVNPYNDTNLMELFRTPSFKISNDLLLATCQRSKPPFWNEFRKLNEPSIQKLNQALECIQTLGHLETWENLVMDSVILNECTQTDPSGRVEGNIWKLITQIHEQARKGILNYADPMEISLQTDSNNENEARSIRESNQIQLMTIHASKGLEFDHVILPFLNHVRKKEGAEFWTTDLENKYWATSMIDTNTRETATSYYARSVVDEVHGLLGEESERLFYVAVTRARKGLYFFPPRETEAISSTGWARHLIDFLSRGPGRYLSEDGTYEFSIEDIDSVPAAVYTPAVQATTKMVPKALPLQHNPHITTTSITGLLKSDQASNSFGVLKKKLEVGLIEKGIKTHRLFESYFSSRGQTTLSPDLQSYIQNTEVPLQELLHQGFPEWPFQIQTPDSIVDGQIDLWGRDQQDRVWIVDYKTGSAKFQEKAFQQMQFYAWALRQTQQIKGDESVNLAVCYPLTQQTFVKVLTPQELNLVTV